MKFYYKYRSFLGSQSSHVLQRYIDIEDGQSIIDKFKAIFLLLVAVGVLWLVKTGQAQNVTAAGYRALYACININHLRYCAVND